MAHWNCAAALCTNNWRNKDSTYFTPSKIGLSTDAALRASCRKVLKSDDVIWNKEVICSQHWSKGNTENIYDLPDRVCSEQCVQNLKKSASEWQSSKQRRWLQLSSRLSFHLVK